MGKSRFFDEIHNAVIEKEVDLVYSKGINLYFPTASITHPFACDGFINTKTEAGKLLKLIIEYKFDELLSSKTGRAKVLIQVVFYMKQFELNGLILPNVCMVGDVNECFVIHTNALLKYLDEDVDWKVAPSTAHFKYPDLVLKIANDEEINPFVFDINENFSFKDVAQKITDLADNVQRYVHVTEHNVATIYDYFCRNVIKNVKKIKSHDLVGIFMGVITNGDEYYQHPTKKNILVTPLGNIDINGDGFKSFFSYFQRNYTPQEKNNLTAIADRLIEDTDRRNNGDFWTPTLFVDYAHKMISEQLGEDWKDKYVVWDNCCGAKNLTRDYKFKELYCSTLFDSELKIGERYNKEAVSFQYDFLNDDLEKLPKGLLEAFEQNKPIVFFLNPPYVGNAGNGVGADGGENYTDTNVKVRMQNNSIDGTKELFNQFLYRISEIKEKYSLTKCFIALFCKPSYLTMNSYKKFRKYFLSNFNYIDGILFNAGEFSNVSTKWGIHFTMWENGETIDKNNFTHKLVENKNGEIVTFGVKNIYNLDGEVSLKDWYSEYKVKTRDVVYPGYKTQPFYFDETLTQKVSKDTIGIISNNISGWNLSNVYLSMKGGYRYLITPDNFKESNIFLSVNNLQEQSWITDKDVLCKPKELNDSFINDCVIYNLFWSQVSLRKVEYKGKLWDIKNEFFWMSKEEIMDLANEYNMDDVYEDAKTSDERYVYKYIQEHKKEFSQEALDVLNKAIELTKKSFKYRQLFADEHPEYQLEKCWDTGFYQLKAIWKEYMKDDFEEFKKLYKVLSDKMRPMVYELGFLK